MDLIDRQAAIEALKEHRALFCDNIPFSKLSYAEKSRVDELDMAIATLINLPSAQPEIIRCKGCKWCEDADGLMCKNPASWVVATDCDFGCVLAERRPDGLQ